MMLNFVRYDETTGKITSQGWMDEKFIQNEISEGNFVLQIEPDIFEFGYKAVDITTKKLIDVTPPPPPPPLPARPAPELRLKPPLLQ